MKKMIKKPEKLVKRKYGMEKGFHFNRDCVKCNQSYHEELIRALEIISKEIRLSETAIKEGYEK